MVEAHYPNAVTKRRSRPPIPKEHGAWVILYIPMLIGFSLAGKKAPLLWFALFVMVTCIFLAREAVVTRLKKRREERNTFWIALYLSLLLLSAIPILMANPQPLLPIGGVGVVAFLLHARLQMLPANRFPQRRVWSEWLGTAALTLTAPAAYTLVTGTLERVAWSLWMWCTLYFLGGIFYVEMWIKAAKRKNEKVEVVRRESAQANLLYHLSLSILLLSFLLIIGGRFALCLLVAFAPSLVRAFYGSITLTNQLPSFKRVGMMEGLRALWFAAWFVAGLTH